MFLEDKVFVKLKGLVKDEMIINENLLPMTLSDF
jgi:hypothetical protein